MNKVDSWILGHCSFAESRTVTDLDALARDVARYLQRSDSPATPGDIIRAVTDNLGISWNSVQSQEKKTGNSFLEIVSRYVQIPEQDTSQVPPPQSPKVGLK